MGIGPISGVRMVEAVKAPPAHSQLAAVFDVAYTARVGEETYSGGGRTASGQDQEEGEDLSSQEEEATSAETDSDGPRGSFSAIA